MKLSNKVKNALQKFIEGEVNEYKSNDGYHKINITELDFGHIVIDIEEHRTEVGNGKEVNQRATKTI